MSQCECRGLYRVGGTPCERMDPPTFVGRCEHVLCEVCAVLVSHRRCCACGSKIEDDGHFRRMIAEVEHAKLG